MHILTITVGHTDINYNVELYVFINVGL